jgi:hippurate hydrolase
MPIVNRIAALADDMAAWRHDFHEHPELLYEVHRTAGIVADRLREFGCDEVVTGIGRTGVVGIIRGRKSTSGKTIGLRADMDALPIEETSGVPYASKTPGLMHACGHDGHTAMLLGAAKYLAETRNFDGTAVMIFQPAEEGGAGGKAMVDDGLMTRWGIQQPRSNVGVGGQRRDHGQRQGRSRRNGSAQGGRQRPDRIADRQCASVDRRAQCGPAEIGGDLDHHVPRRHGL